MMINIYNELTFVIPKGMEATLEALKQRPNIYQILKSLSSIVLLQHLRNTGLETLLVMATGLL